MKSASSLPAQLDISPTHPEEAETIMAIAHDVGVFDDEEVATVDELLGEYLGQGAPASGYNFLSCCVSGHVIGFACYGPRALTHGNTFDLFWIAVNKDVQGCGAGGALLQRVAQEIQAMSGRLIIAETSGRADYLPTRRFYETHGYQWAATIPDFYAPGDDLIVYVQRLPADSTPAGNCTAIP